MICKKIYTIYKEEYAEYVRKYDIKYAEYDGKYDRKYAYRTKTQMKMLR
jgi:hypothetical protein